MRVLEFTFSPEDLSLSHRLRTLPPPDGRAALFAYGLDELAPRDRETAIHSLNWGRERLAWAGYSVVLWVRPGTLSDLAFQAPDFWAWRSAAFILEWPEDEVQQAQALAILRLESAADLEELRQRYLEYLVATYRWLDFRGLLQVRRILRMPLNEVYVPLRATTRTHAAVPEMPPAGPEGLERLEASLSPGELRRTVARRRSGWRSPRRCGGTAAWWCWGTPAPAKGPCCGTSR